MSLTEPIDQTSVVAPSAEELVHLFAEVDQTIVCTDLTGRITYLSPNAEAITGYRVDQMLGVRLQDVIDPDEIEGGREVLETLARGAASSVRLVFRPLHRDGSRRTIEAVVQVRRRPDGRPCGAMGTISDVTAQKDAELSLRHSQKLESVGRLAAGIAHEINTPIQFIGDNLYFLSESFERVTALLDRYRSALDGSAGEMSWTERRDMLRSAEDQADMEFVVVEVPDAVEAALGGVQRVADIVRAMKVFGHPDGTEGHAVDIDEIVRNTLIVARNEMKYVARVDAHYGAPPVVIGRPGDLGQVFLNLFVNAADAVREVVGVSGELGRITIRTGVEDGIAVVTVTDSGAGIASEVASHVFEPFFTTKEVGRGTGQGLSLAMAIVDRHHGHLGFEAAPGGGTTFTVRLPLGPVEA